MRNDIRVHVGDTRTLLALELKQPDESGALVAVDLTNTTQTFKLVNTADGAVVVTETGVSVVSAVSGHVNYDFAASGVANAGIYRAFVVVDQGGETDHFPVKTDDLRVFIDSDSQTAEEAYDAAIASS